MTCEDSWPVLCAWMGIFKETQGLFLKVVGFRVWGLGFKDGRVICAPPPPKKNTVAHSGANIENIPM